MTSALQTVKKVYSSFSEGDVAGFLALCAEDIEWVVNGPATAVQCKAYSGRQGVQEFLGLLAHVRDFSAFSPRQFIDCGSTVIVLGDAKGRDTGRDVQLEARWVHIVDVRDGQITRFREFLCQWENEERPPEMSWNDI